MTAVLRSPRRLPALAFGVFALARLPSFFEPHWYTDEAGYTATAQGLLNGKILYAGIWNNKPPLHLWTIAAILRLAGPSEAALHVVTFVSGLATLAAVAWAAFKLMPPRVAGLAVLAAAVVMGLPLLDGELALPESFLVAPTAWAGALLLVRLQARAHGHRDRGWWPAAVGGLAATGIAFQQTALADAAAFGLILLISPRVRRREFALYAAAVALPTAAWLVAVAALAGWSNVAFALAGFYIPYTQSALPVALGGRLLYGVGLLLALGLAVAALVAMRRDGAGAAAGLWAVAALLVPAAAQQPFPHFLLPVVAPVCLAVPLIWRELPELRLAGPRWASAALLAALVGAGLMARGAGVDWIPPLSSDHFNGYRTLTTYYLGPLDSLRRTGSLVAWQDMFDDRVPGDRAVTAWVKRNHFQGSAAVVWSSDAWLYATADLDQVMPTAPIYNDFVLLGTDGQVGSRVRLLEPPLIIVADADSDEFPEIRPVLVQLYRPVYTAGPETVWLRADLPAPTS